MAVDSKLNLTVAPVRVNGHLISSEEIAREVQYHPANSAAEAAFQAARALIVRHLLLERATDMGILDASARQDETVEEARIRTLLERELEVPEASEMDLKRYYETNPDRFMTSPLLEASHILLAADPADFSGRQAAREQAEVLISQLQNSEGLFVDFVQQFSGCPSKQEGGRLGQIGRGQTTPEFERQLLRLPVGLSSSPLESRYGFHIVEVHERIEGARLPFESCKDQIAQRLRDNAWLQALTHYLSILVGEADIEGIDLNEAPGSGPVH
jgi:peptidyl-prolyl cis-trans isomerase C